MFFPESTGKLDSCCLGLSCNATIYAHPYQACFEKILILILAIACYGFFFFLVCVWREYFFFLSGSESQF